MGSNDIMWNYSDKLKDFIVKLNKLRSKFNLVFTFTVNFREKCPDIEIENCDDNSYSALRLLFSGTTRFYMYHEGTLDDYMEILDSVLDYTIEEFELWLKMKIN